MASREILLSPAEEGQAGWDPTEKLSPRSPLGKGVEVEYESGISTVRIQGSPSLERSKRTHNSSSSSEPGTPSSVTSLPLPSPLTPASPANLLPASSTIVLPNNANVVAEKKSAKSSKKLSSKPPSESSQISAATSTSSSSSSSSTQSSNNNAPNKTTDKQNVPSTYKSGRLKSAVSDKKQKKPVEFDNISIISDIPSDPGGASIGGTIRSYHSNLSPIQEGDSFESARNNNDVFFTLPKMGTQSKKVSWNESVIITTTDSDNVMLAGLPYEPSDTSSTVSSRGSTSRNSQSPLPSPSDFSSQPHRSASRIYHRTAPEDTTPIVDEFELAQLGQMLGSRQPPTPNFTMATTRVSQPLPGPPLQGPPVIRPIQDDQAPRRSSWKHQSGCVTCAIVLIVFAVIALVALGILYALRTTTSIAEDPIEVIKTMKSGMNLKYTRSKDVWMYAWGSNQAEGQVFYMVEGEAMLPWQRPADDCFLAWHRGGAVRVYSMNEEGHFHTWIVGDPVSTETADIHIHLENGSYYAAELLSDEDHYAVVSITGAPGMRWDDMRKWSSEMESSKSSESGILDRFIRKPEDSDL